jgi:hypothetical protein
MSLCELRARDNWTRAFARGWRVAIFLFTLVVATLIYLASGNVIVSTVLPCCHAGWRTFRTGLWILRTDPRRFRARTCFAYYVAAACCNAAFAALLVVGIFIEVALRTGVEPSMDEFIATMWVLIIGVLLNTALGIAATVAAIVGKIRVWVHPRLQSILHGDLRLAPQHPRRYPGLNYAIFVLGTAYVCPLVTLLAILLAVLPIGVTREEADSSIVLMVGSFAILVLPVAALPGYAWLSARVVARHPAECWPRGTVENIEPNAHGPFGDPPTDHSVFRYSGK